MINVSSGRVVLDMRHIKGHIPNLGDMIYDGNTEQTLIWDGQNWIVVASNNPQPKIKKEPSRIMEKLKDQKTEDIIDTMVVLMIRSGIIKDVDEFKEMIEANKLAKELSEN